MRIRALQHVASEGPGSLVAWAKARGHSLETTRLDRGEPLPAVDAFDLLVVLGGPMSANDEAIHPWLVGEKRLIGETIQTDRRVLGICLGAQVVASALGRRVERMASSEIGWYPVRLRREAARSRTFEGMPATFTPLHWHGETFELPSGAIHLAESDHCANQAFEIEFDGGPSRGGALVLALQFHLEATAESVGAMLDAEEICAAGPDAGAPIPRREDLLGAPARFAAVYPLLERVLDRLTEKPAAR
ncbi:MAG TPA: type 1 glutamine amidotransferase [Candidatus Eisenbacteria bacterium]|nr:type 1 glutamine amidotransferase [Candidatus Eisenbacteria bacterium]